LAQFSKETFMTNKHLAYLLATTLLATPALAQTGGSPGTSPAPSPGATEMQRDSSPGMGGAAGGMQDRSTTGQSVTPSAPAATTGGQATSAQPTSEMRSTTASADLSQPLAAPGPNQMMVSDVRGTRVYGANNENVGDVSDVLLSRDGQVVAFVVGVGGFLGIGQKDVAIPFQAFDFVTEGQPVAGRTSTTTTTTTARAPAAPADSAATRAPAGPGAPPAAPAPQRDSATTGLSGVTGSTGAAQTTSPDPVTTGSTPGRTTTTTTSGAEQHAGLLKPERIVLRGMTKADLEAAPEFRRTAASNQRNR
jgi:sporulation protein YlmC with PRC-barrel domain